MLKSGVIRVLIIRCDRDDFTTLLMNAFDSG
jgi:hypothetical protein